MMNVSDFENICQIWASYMEWLFGGKCEFLIIPQCFTVRFKLKNDDIGEFLMMYYFEDIKQILKKWCSPHYVDQLKEYYSRELQYEAN